MRRLLALILIASPLLLTTLVHAATTTTSGPRFQPGPYDPSRNMPPPPPLPPPVIPPVVVTPPQPEVDPCAAQISERDGIVGLSLHDPARAAQAITVSVDEFSYTQRFDPDGQLHAEAPVFHTLADVEWTGMDGHPCHRRGVGFSGFASASRLALVWSGPFQLTLHAVEPPNGKLGGVVGYVSPARPNLDGATGLGSLRHFGEAVAGTSQVELYDIPADRHPEHGYFLILTEFADRGSPAVLPYCSDGAYAGVKYSIITVQAARMARRNFAIQAANCGQKWDTGNSNSGYFQRFSWDW